MPQCRFCLEDADEDQLIAPCNCDGSHKFVHQECLAEWRRGRFPGARRRCNVCNAKWTTKPPPRAEREFFARAVKTAPRYRPAARDVAHAAALRALLQSAGGLIAQAPRRAEAEAEALQGDDAILTWATDANAAAARREERRGPAPRPRRASRTRRPAGPRRPAAPSTRGGRRTRRRRHSHSHNSSSRRSSRASARPSARRPISSRGAWPTRCPGRRCFLGRNQHFTTPSVASSPRNDTFGSLVDLCTGRWRRSWWRSCARGPSGTGTAACS